MKDDIFNIKDDMVNIKDDMVNIKDDMVNIKEDITNIKKELKVVNIKQDILINKFEDFEPKNATRHIDIYNKIETIAKDVKFVKHKLHETEEEVFDIKDQLRLTK